MATRRRASAATQENTAAAAVQDTAAEQVQAVAQTQTEAAAPAGAAVANPFAPMVLAYLTDGTPLHEISLQKIVEVTQSPAGFLYTLNSPDQAQMAAAGLIDLSPETAGPEGFTATRATLQGIQSIMEQNQTAAAAGQVQSSADAAGATSAAAEKQKPVFEVETLSDLPEVKRAAGTGAGRTETYPFASLNAPATGADNKPVYSSFFVPGKTPSQMASTVNGANARYAEKTGKKRMTRASAKHPAREVDELNFTRQFEARAASKNGVQGVYIVRTK